MEKTLAIMKPDAVRNRHMGHILSRIETEGFRVLGLQLVQLDTARAKEFYKVHAERPFYNDLCSFMCSGPVVVLALEAEGAVAKWRDLVGATDPKEAAENTIRKLYAESKEANTAHGSDSVENGVQEVAFFFPNLS